MISTIFNKLGSIFRKSKRKEAPVKHKTETKTAIKKTVRPSQKSKPNRTVKKVDHKPAWTINDFVVPEKEGEIRFHDLDIPTAIMHAIADLKFKYCTPIQAQLLPPTLKGKDAIGKAQTGTGKTAAFLIAIFARILRRKISNRKAGFPRALILAPTRELAMQIEKDAIGLAKYTNIKTLAVYGGMDYKKQKNRLASQIVDVLVATPGRLIDFKKNGDVNLSAVEFLIIDEADRMLDMGFIPDVRSIVRSTPFKDKRQTLFFSATISSEVERLSDSWTTDSVTVEIEPENVAAESVDQKIYIVTSEEKFSLLYNIIQKNNLQRVMVFCNRKDEAHRVYERLYSHGINSQQISGDVDQRKRIRTLEEFKAGKINVLVATDVAGRGIHIDGVSHVINFSLPENPEDYVHRIGRTGRAGASGISVGFATEDDSFNIPSIEKYLDKKLDCIYPDDELVQLPPTPVRKIEKKQPQKRQFTKQNNNTKKNYRPKQGNYRKKSSNPENKNK